MPCHDIYTSKLQETTSTGIAVSPNMFIGNPELFVVPVSYDRHDLMSAIDLGHCQSEELVEDPRGCKDLFDTLLLRD